MEKENKIFVAMAMRLVAPIIKQKNINLFFGIAVHKSSQDGRF